MMMTQTAIKVALSQHPDMHPSRLLSIVNGVITENIHKLHEDKYMTITVLAVHDEGKFYYSGLHQDIMVYRQKTGSVELFETRGMWLGILRDIVEMVDDDVVTLGPGDTMLIYTDGITEAWEKGSVKDHRDPEKSMYGDERLVRVFKDLGEKPTEEIKQGIIDSLENYKCYDDVTLVLLRRIG
jgi:serine phosphatase RsbU (regulator of sigma subunit)